MITKKILNEKYTYSLDGFLINKKTGHKVAGYLNKKSGYLYIGIRTPKLKIMRYHRIIYEFHCGEIKGHIDHINGVKMDNRIENLRECTRSQNMGNMKKQRGVYKRGTSFYAMITVQKEVHYLGTFKTEIEARHEYKKASILFFGDFSG